MRSSASFIHSAKPRKCNWGWHASECVQVPASLTFKPPHSSLLIVFVMCERWSWRQSYGRSAHVGCSFHAIMVMRKTTDLLNATVNPSLTKICLSKPGPSNKSRNINTPRNAANINRVCESDAVLQITCKISMCIFFLLFTLATKITDLHMEIFICRSGNESLPFCAVKCVH